MRGGSRGVAASMASVVLAAAGVTSCGFMGIYGCTDRDERFAQRLNDLAVLDLHPPGSTPSAKGGWGCDDDDGFAFAERMYSPAPGADVHAYYRKALPAEGWRLESINAGRAKPDSLPVGAQRLCFTRTIEGADAYLAVWFPSEFGEKTDDFGLSLTASHDGSAYC